MDLITEAKPIVDKLRGSFYGVVAIAKRHAAALEKIIAMNRQQGIDQFGDAEVAESWSCVRVARASLAGSEIPTDADLKAGHRAPWVKRAVAYKLLLAYAECMEAMKFSWRVAKPVFVKHGYESYDLPSDFMLSLRTRALEAAKEAG